MTERERFLRRLQAGLRGLPRATVADIVGDYARHFDDAAARGRSEADAAAALGDPARLARELRAEAGLRRWEDERSLGAGLGVVVALLGFAALDLLVLLPVLLAAASVVLVVLLVALGVFIGGCAMLVASPFGLGTMIGLPPLPSAALSVAMIAGAVSATALCLLVIAGGVGLLARYARAHYRLLAPQAPLAEAAR
jgi:uncharacterized membrane protein